MQEQDEHGNNFPSQALFNEMRLAQHDEHLLTGPARRFFLHFQPIVGYPSVRLPQRLRLFELGAVALCVRVLRVFEHNDDLCAWMWRIIRDAVCVFDNERVDEFATVDLAVEHGVLHEIVRELERALPTTTPRHGRGAARLLCMGHAFAALTTICLVERHAVLAAQSGVAAVCVALCELEDDDVMTEDFITSALGSLKNLAMAPQCVSVLVEAGAARVTNKYTWAIEAAANATPDGTLKLGLCACSLLVRLEHGAGEVEMLFYDKLAQLLRNVFQAGPGGTVIQSGWNPANIVLDLMLLVVSTTRGGDKEHEERCRRLRPFVRLLCDGLRMRGERNLRLVRFTIGTLFHMYLLGPPLASEFCACGLTISCEMTRAITVWRDRLDLETLQMATALRSEVQSRLLSKAMEGSRTI